MHSGFSLMQKPCTHVRAGTNRNRNVHLDGMCAPTHGKLCGVMQPDMRTRSIRLPCCTIHISLTAFLFAHGVYEIDVGADQSAMGAINRPLQLVHTPSLTDKLVQVFLK